MDYLEVTKAEYVGGHKLHLWFSNNIDKVVDFTNLLQGEVFAPLRDETYFKNFHITYNTVEWDNGADFAPEYLFAQ